MSPTEATAATPAPHEPATSSAFGERALAPASTLPRFSLTLVSTLHALVFATAAVVLPWRGGAAAALVLLLLASLHVTTAVLALARRERALCVVWQTLAFASLFLLLVATAIMASAALYLAELYQGIGQAIAGALAGIWGLLVLVTVPVSCWGLASTGFRWRWRSGAAVAVVLALALLGVGRARAAARAQPVPLALEPGLQQSLREVLRAHAPEAPAAPGSLFQREPMQCAEPITPERATLFVAYVGQDGGPHGACLQETRADALARALKQLLAEQSRAGATVELELVLSLRELSALHPLIDALKLRPGLDGACLEGRCLLPWQLVGLDVFTRHRPLPAVRDMSFGFSPRGLARLLGRASASLSDIASIETLSYVASRGQVSELARLRPAPAPLKPDAVEARAVAREQTAGAGEQNIDQAARLAEAHILAAQEADGSFRYLLNPFTGARPNEGGTSLPRQAGTALVLCELGTGTRSASAARQALAWLAVHERRADELSWLTSTGADAELGPTALPLVALLSCRERTGNEHDALIARLGRFLLRMQRPNGSFFPEFDPGQRTPKGRHESLYGAGQAVFALVLLERFAQTVKMSELPAPTEIATAIDRAMDFYAGHWPRALRDFFFLEENWHCLAARAALAGHRRAGYEQFCLDYVTFKSRLILDQGAVPEFVGGYGLGNLFPPHYTATAGFAEALSAALAVEQARGADLRPKQALLRKVLGFLARGQWDGPACFACTTMEPVTGGFSEHVASPIIRIDYVQHALAALGHGGGALAGASGAGR